MRVSFGTTPQPYDPGRIEQQRTDNLRQSGKLEQKQRQTIQGVEQVNEDRKTPYTEFVRGLVIRDIGIDDD